MTALLIIGAAIVCCAAVLVCWALCAASGRADDAAHAAEVLALLAAERARTEMRERLIHARIREGRR